MNTKTTGCKEPKCLVLEDYMAKLDEAQEKLTKVITETAKLLTSTKGPLHIYQANNDTTLIVFNPLSFDREEIILTTLPKGYFGIQTEDGKPIIAQYDAAISTNNIYFSAKVPAFGISTFYFVKDDMYTFMPSIIFKPEGIQNDKIKISFNSDGFMN